MVGVKLILPCYDSGVRSDTQPARTGLLSITLAYLLRYGMGNCTEVLDVHGQGATNVSTGWPTMVT